MSIRSLTRLSPDSFVGSLVRWPLRLIPRGHVVSVRGGINRGARWIAGSSTHGCWLGTYEPEKQALVARLARPGMVAWDVGANAGFYTLAFSRLVGDSGRVYAFEPLAENVRNLLEHVRLNRAANIRVVQAALSDRDGLDGFSVAASNAMGHLDPSADAYIIPAISADEFLDHCPDARPDLIKIDIEGGEGHFLAGATRLLQRCSPEILLAWHGEGQGDTCLRLLRSHGYAMFDLDGAAATPVVQDRGEVHARRETPPGTDAAGERESVLISRAVPASARVAPVRME